MKKEFGKIREIGGNLYIDCRIYGERVRMASNHPDTPENTKKLRVFLNKVGNAVKDGSFRFKDFFPRAKAIDQNKFATIEAGLFKEKQLLSSEVVLNDYIAQWILEEEQTMGKSKKIDYRDLLNSRIRPMVGHLAFSEINSKILKVFVRNLKHVDGPKKGAFLSAKRMRNILTLFHRIYLEACCENQWHLQDPFPIAFNRVRKIESLIEEKGLTHDKSREVWLLAEWLIFIDAVPCHYRPMFECLRMGMIFSELKALKKDHVFENHMEVTASISRGVEKETGKTKYRGRTIPLTKRLRENMCQAMQSSKTDYVFTMEDGVTPLNYTTIREDIWAKSLRAVGLPHRKMYGLRHTFIGWMVMLGVDSARLKMLAGHASRSTLTEDTYGDFREGLLDERELILEYLGRDVLDPEEFKRAFSYIYLKENGFDSTLPPPTVGLNPASMKALASMVAAEVNGNKSKILGISDVIAPLITTHADNYGGRLVS